MRRMRIPMEVRGQLATRFEVLLPHLNERQQRLALAVEARLLGHGGVRAVAQVAGVSETTVHKGVVELEAGQAPLPPGRVRRPGGGRKPAARQDPALVPALLALVEPDERGDPMSPLRWTTKSLRHLAEELTRQGHPVSAPTVGRLLKREGFSLQANVKTLEGGQHPDRDAQFRYLNQQVKDHQADGEPVISVDTKKREQLGRLPMAGREWHPRGQPVKVEDHHFFFTGPEVEQAIPYGIYDLTRNTGWVNVGVDHDTCVFAVASIRRWWQARGSLDYPQATRLLITADAGGSNGYRHRVWKSELAALAAETGLQVTVCHFPPGTSKWNKIEHRLFSHITFNWRGRPLTSHEVVVKTIAATTPRTGLRVEAALDTGDYPTGVAISKQRFDALPLQRHATHSAWNYTLHPHPAAPSTQPEPVGEQDGPARRRQAMLGRLADPRLTGTDLQQLAALLAPAQAARTQQRYAEQALRPARTAIIHTLSDPTLTGMSRQELHQLTQRLTPRQAAHAERRTHQRRGGPRQPGTRRGVFPQKISNSERVLLTILHRRKLCTLDVLANALGDVSRSAIGNAVRATRPLLEQDGRIPPPAAIRYRTATELLTAGTASRDTPTT